MAASGKLEERIVRVETTLNALKIAASVLGLTGGAVLLGLIFVSNKATAAYQQAEEAKGIASSAATEVSKEQVKAVEAIKEEAESRKRAIEKEFSDGVTSGLFRVEPNLSACKEESRDKCPESFDLKCPDGKVLVHLRNFGGSNTCTSYWKCCDLALKRNA